MVYRECVKRGTSNGHLQCTFKVRYLLDKVKTSSATEMTYKLMKILV